MNKFINFFSNLKLGWVFIFTSLKLWCNYMLDDSKFNFWTDGFYSFDEGPNILFLNWSNYELIMKSQKKPRGRGKLKYPNTVTGFLKWQSDHFCSS